MNLFDIDKKSGIDIVLPVWEQIMLNSSSFERTKFLSKFNKGYENRPSVRYSQPTKTIPDDIIDILLHARIPKLSEKQIHDLGIGHRISMAAENILGVILEEYIHNKVFSLGWSCCWGNSITAVDFCSKSGTLLQVKNRSNTENSSSNKIRVGTSIEKWYRVNATNGQFYWEELCKIIGKPHLFSEKEFRLFCTGLIKNNPHALSISELEIKSLG